MGVGLMSADDELGHWCPCLLTTLADDRTIAAANRVPALCGNVAVCCPALPACADPAALSTSVAHSA